MNRKPIYYNLVQKQREGKSVKGNKKKDIYNNNTQRKVTIS